jgi:nonsense-mediated mRNA decay protein 3
MFCIKCGKEAVKGTVFCRECYSQGEPLASVPASATFDICPSCGRVKKGAHWIYTPDLGEYVRSDIRKNIVLPRGTRIASYSVTGFRNDRSSSRLRITITAERDGMMKDEETETAVHLRRNTCPTCNRKSGHYFESTIQIRALGSERKEVLAGAADYVRKLGAELELREPDFFISSVKATRGGFDINLSSSSAGYAIARSTAQRYGTGVSRTRTLYGQKDGRNVFRTTYLIRIPMFRARDYVEFEDGFYRVTDTTGRVVLESLEDGRHLTIQPAELEKLRFVGGREIESTATIISSGNGTVTVVERNFAEEESIRCEGHLVRGREVGVVRLGGRLYLL